MRFGNGLEFTNPNLEKIELFVDEKILEEPLRRKQPAKIFVGDMFDLFHEAIPDEFIASVFVRMWHAKQHTYQLLTKRADRLHNFFAGMGQWQGYTTHNGKMPSSYGGDGYICGPQQWPLPNVWLGVSVENQDYIWRIDELRQTPATVRFLSVEPLLADMGELDLRGIDWVIVGGESGHGARPFHIEWAESLLKQCREAGVAFFMKQVGSKPMRDGKPLVSEFTRDGKFANLKGGMPYEWPESLRVREWPEVRERWEASGGLV